MSKSNETIVFVVLRTDDEDAESVAQAIAHEIRVEVVHDHLSFGPGDGGWLTDYIVATERLVLTPDGGAGVHEKRDPDATYMHECGTIVRGSGECPRCGDE